MARAVASAARRRWVIGVCGAAITLGALGVSPSLADKALPSWYQERGTWRETMAASLEAIQAGGAAAAKAGVPECGPWHISRTYGAKTLAEQHAPETKGVKLDLDKGRKAQWKRRGDIEDGVVFDTELRSEQAVYLYRIMTAAGPGSVDAYLGGRVPVAVTLNGKPVTTASAGMAAQGLPLLRGKLPLVAGKNELLVKLFLERGAAPFYFSFSPTPGPTSGPARFALLTELLRKRISDAGERREFEWELNDRVWAWNRTPTPAAMARQYAHVLPAAYRQTADALARQAGPDELRQLRELYVRSKQAARVTALAGGIDLDALGLAVADLSARYGRRYPKGDEYRKQIAALTRERPALLKQAELGEPTAIRRLEALATLQREALLANPAIDFRKILLVIRRGKSTCLPNNYHGNCALPRGGFDDSLETLELADGTRTVVYRPERDVFVGDVDLNFDAKTLLFSSLDARKRWQIFELGVDGKGLRQVTPGSEDDVDNYDPCYLPNGRIIFSSTRCFTGVPCVGGKAQVANFCLMNADGTGIRQLCFDQEHNWCPTVMPNGKVMYTRWEYTDTPHYFTRLIMTMNPDGTQQMGYYGSNSFWPTSIFYARPVPGDATKFMAVVSGHHGTRRSGPLYLFDPARGRQEIEGVVQQIPGRGKPVEATIKDRLADGVWPQFLHPFPLDASTCLVAGKLSSRDSWNIYLADTFDNLLELCSVDGADLYEPVPLKPVPRPPVIPDKVDPKREDGVAYLVDIYAGPGLKDVPRGTVKALRLFQWHYAYNMMGGHNAVTIEGGWEPKRILGTVPVEADGSALFRVPADTPLALQPLDDRGRAMQLMRSWFTVQRGEVISCVGCHEPQNETPGLVMTQAARRAPSEIEPWFGPARGMSFVRDVQPVLEHRCVACHDGTMDGRPNFKDTQKVQGFTASYHALHPYVRRPGPESDYHLLRPMEYHASTSELIAMLGKGHHGVALDDDEWSRLYTWIDMNVPDYGTWHEQRGDSPFMARRAEMMKLYACVNIDPEAIAADAPAPRGPVKPAPVPPTPAPLTLDGWPLTGEQARARQAACGEGALSLDLGDGVTLELVRIPAGRFVMGDAGGLPDERPQAVVTIAKAFWIGKCEVSNRQYARFDPAHDSRYIDQQWKDHTTPGYAANLPEQPVIRVTWERAAAFCAWLGERTGRRCALPTEAQWEYACRAGTDTPFWYGGQDGDFSACENLADRRIVELAVKGVNPQPIAKPDRLTDFVPRDSRFDDGHKIVTAVGGYRANPWGLYDMHGNVAEWTRTDYRPYPYRDDDGRNAGDRDAEKVMRGGSWRDRPAWSRASVRRAYMPWQPVFNGGFRIVVEE